MTAVLRELGLWCSLAVCSITSVRAMVKSIERNGLNPSVFLSQMCHYIHLLQRLKELGYVQL